MMQLQEQALLARQWILLAMGALADARHGIERHDSDTETLVVVDQIMGAHDSETLKFTFDTLEATYVSMINLVFRYEPVQEIQVDWTDAVVYPSKLYHGPNCSKDEYPQCEGCTPGTFAYVFPVTKKSTDGYGRRVINLCPAFFTSLDDDLTGLDEDVELWQGSRVGTLIHEVSHHFPSGTDDVEDIACADLSYDYEEFLGEEPCYGFQRASNLAQQAPEKAKLNADNYLYLAEMLTRGKQRHSLKWAAFKKLMQHSIEEKTTNEITRMFDGR